MTTHTTFAACAAAVSMALLAGPALAQGAQAAPAQPPAGKYYMDPSHSTVVLRVSHLGFSNYTMSFAKVEGTLTFDPANPAAMTVEATIDPASLTLPAPPAGFHATITGKGWLDAGAFPKITFRSTKVEPTGPRTAKVSGDLSFHGVTKPVTIEATYNGGWAKNAFDGDRVGFSGKGVLTRSEFGVASGIPAPGSTMGVSDAVDFVIETEFSSNPPAARAA
ncbi:YceI family protein [Phenylobacterium sp.]|uniref:YceI family protein n=1 Tax=Phenylobacterium sp. TaxID=1871053 RepID=UPI003524BF1B